MTLEAFADSVGFRFPVILTDRSEMKGVESLP